MDKVIFSKINDKYIPEYQLTTKIIKVDNNIVVKKYALSNKSINHLNNIFQSYSVLCQIYGDSVNICPVKQKQDFIEFEYIDSSYAYTKLLLDAVSNNDIDKFYEIFDNYLVLVFNKNNKVVDFYETKEFQDLFGKLDDKIIESNSLKSLQFTPFDMTVNNLLVKDNHIYFIDYEWFFNFPIPVDLFYYHLIYIINDVCNLKDFIELENLYNRFKPNINFNIVNEIYQNFIKKITVFLEIGKSIIQIENHYVKNQYNIQDLYISNDINNKRIAGLESSESYYKQREKDLLAAVEYNETRINGLIESEKYYKQREKDLLAAVEYNETRVNGLIESEKYYKQREKDLLAAVEYNETRVNGLIESEKYYKQREKDLLAAVEYNETRVNGLIESEKYYKQREKDLLAAVEYNETRVNGLIESEKYYKQREKDLLAAIDYHHAREDAFIEQENILHEQINILNTELQNSKNKELELIDTINKTNYFDVTKKYIKKILQKIKRV